MNHKKKQPSNRVYEEKDNLGVDADGSSEDFSFNGDLNSDYDRVTGNPDGENDLSYPKSHSGSNPLMDK